MSEIADFLRARYAAARKVEESKRRLRNDIDFEWEHHYGMDDEYVLLGGHRRVDADEFWQQHGEPAPDPAVIADLDAKLALVDEIEPHEEPREPETDVQLHTRFAHPAWEYRTTSGPRKQWDDADVPPTGEEGDPDPTWERNVNAGRDGWERWDHTEESYWRRLRLDGPRPPHIPRGLRILAQPFVGHPDHKGEEWTP